MSRGGAKLISHRRSSWMHTAIGATEKETGVTLSSHLSVFSGR